MRDSTAQHSCACLPSHMKTLHTISIHAAKCPTFPPCSVKYMACILESVVTNTDETAQFHHSTCPQAVRGLNSPSLNSTDQLPPFDDFICFFFFCFFIIDHMLCLMTDLAKVICGFYYYVFILSLATLVLLNFV